MDMPTMDHRGPEFALLTLEILKGLKQVFKTSADVVIYPASGTGAWEAALVNTLSAGDKVLIDVVLNLKLIEWENFYKFSLPHGAFED
jgi:alanine-glyoxylate transaminase/serine-glyoxylate transaminase/serine-pyruvate transaminase